MAGGLPAVKARLRRPPGQSYRERMTERKSIPGKANRSARLAEQLRANLRRRKAQARGEGPSPPARDQGDAEDSDC